MTTKKLSKTRAIFLDAWERLKPFAESISHGEYPSEFDIAREMHKIIKDHPHRDPWVGPTAVLSAWCFLLGDGWTSPEKCNEMCQGSVPYLAAFQFARLIEIEKNVDEH